MCPDEASDKKCPFGVPVIPTKTGGLGAILNSAPQLLERLSTLTERLTGLPFQTVVDFFSVGMLMNVAAAMDLPSVDERWTSWCPKDSPA